MKVILFPTTTDWLAGFVVIDGAELTDIVIAFEVAVAGLTQVAVEVITQVTASPFVSMEF